MPMTTIQSLAALEIPAAGGGVYYGGSQTWYASHWHRLSGCGPTTGANLVWYLAQTRPGLSGLWNTQHSSRGDFTPLMDTMFDYITPGMRGVNKVSTFEEGALRFAADRGFSLRADILAIPPDARARPGREQMGAFLLDAVRGDRPVAFLNLSNGSVRNLDNWHWVTLAGVIPGELKALMYDQGRRSIIDLSLWQETTTRGGGFVTLDQEPGGC